MLSMVIQNYLLNNRKLFRTVFDIRWWYLFSRVSLFELEKKRTDGLQSIVVVLQKVWKWKLKISFYLYFSFQHLRSWRQYRIFHRDIAAVKIQNFYRKYSARNYINQLTKLFRYYKSIYIFFRYASRKSRIEEIINVEIYSDMPYLEEMLHRTRLLNTIGEDPSYNGQLLESIWTWLIVCRNRIFDEKSLRGSFALKCFIWEANQLYIIGCSFSRWFWIYHCFCLRILWKPENHEKPSKLVSQSRSICANWVYVSDIEKQSLEISSASD